MVYSSDMNMSEIDSRKFHLGPICKNGHDFAGSGRSLRYNSSPNCVTCAKNYRKARDASIRQKKLANKPVYPDGMKKCPNCTTLIPVTSWRCQPCKTEYQRADRARNADRRRERSRELAREFREKQWHVSLWRGCRSSHKKRGLSFSITADDLRERWDNQDGRCYWTGVEMITSGDDLRHPLRVSIDRIDPMRGYEPGNIALACLFVNLGRGQSSPALTREVIEKIAAAYRMER